MDDNWLTSLIDRSQQGDDEAFMTLVREFDQEVRNFVKRLGIPESDIDDVAANVWTNAWRGIRRFRAEAKFKTWLFSIAANVTKDQRRRAQKHKRVYSVLLQQRIESAAAPEAFTSEWGDLDPLLALLPPDQREALVLVYGQGLSSSEGAIAAGVRYKTFASRLFRGREAMRGHLSTQRGALE